jgi:hypothetical protein
MPAIMGDIHPGIFALAFMREMVSWLGTPYLLGGDTKGVSVDCSGLFDKTFEAVGLEINDRTVDDYVTEGILQASQPRFGAEIKVITTKIGATHDHMAYRFHPRRVLHATNNATWVAANGGSDGCMVTDYDSYLSVSNALGATYHWYLDMAGLLTKHLAEAP